MTFVTRHFLPCVFASLTLLALIGGGTAHAQTTYTFVDLGVSNVTGINNNGQVCGNTFRINPVLVNGTLVWNKDDNGDGINDLVQPLPLLNGTTSSRAKAINASGQVAGSVVTTKGSNTALWSATSSAALTPLAPNASYAEGINDGGDLVGTVTIRAGNYACLWKKAGSKYTATQLPDLSGCTNGFARAVNTNRQVVGVTYPTNGSTRVAFFWSASTGTISLPYPVGHLPGGLVNAINAAGQASGTSNTGTYDTFTLPDGALVNRPLTVAFLYDHASGSSFALGTPAGFVSTEGWAMNSAIAPQIVGSARRSYADGSGYSAFVWQNGGSTDLNTVTAGVPFGATLTGGIAINDSGYIIGGYNVNGQTRAFLLIPGP
ncbi:hypothetical protein [Armatimonas sp.]|uniref:hypothetical protein n=1 Tax=Armatimonas sp. TaxID=1872638 RepID=UPI003750141D